MVILHVITTMNRGGAENHVRDLAVGQSEQGHTVHVAFLKGDGYWQSDLRNRGIGFHRLARQRAPILTAFRPLGRLLTELDPDVVHCHLPAAELVAGVMCLFGGSRAAFVVTRHNTGPFVDAPGWFRRPVGFMLGRWCAHRAHCVIAISPAVRDLTRDYYAVASNSIRTVDYGLDPRPFEAPQTPAQNRFIRQSLGVPENALVVGTIARYVPQKALDRLLRAFASARTRFRQNTVLLFVGRGPLEGRLRALAVKLGIEDAVVWAGFRDDIPSVIRSIDVFALSSDYEGFGLVLLEAMAAGVPVVATGVSSVGETICDGEGGLVVNSLEPDDFGDALLMLDDPMLRQQLGRRAQRRVRDVFGLLRMINEVLDAYAMALRARSAR